MPAYVSNRFPSLKIGDRVAFQDGLFETDDPELVALIERNEWFGVHIHPRDLPAGGASASEPAPPASPAPVPEASAGAPEVFVPRVRQGSRGTR